MNVHGLYDADQALYMAGFGAAQTVYQIFDDGIMVHEEKYAKDAKQWVVDQSEEYRGGQVTIEKYTNPMPLEHSLHNLKTIVEQALEKSGCDTYKMYLSQGSTFRDEITDNAEYIYAGKNKMYKGNRIDTPKPHWFNAMVDFLVDNYDVTICHGVEADDAVAIQATKLNKRGIPCVIISADKDLNTVPGMHYNPQKGLLYNVDEDAADEWFWCQMIIGDSADNIAGLPRKGAAAAIKILDGCIGFEERRKAVMDAYFEHYKDLEFSDVQQIIYDTMNLLWMLREYKKDDNGNLKLRW